MRIVRNLLLTVLAFMLVPIAYLFGAMIGMILPSDYGPNGAAIGGGIIGAILGLILAIILTILIWFKKQKKEASRSRTICNG